ncbi:MAG: hypothetical protein ACR2KK_03805 [Acidimicrobiales bacterium]
MALLVAIAAGVLLSTRFSLGDRPALRAAASALLTAAVLGSVLNDSGVVVAASVLAIAWPAGVVIATQARQPERAQ